MPYAKTPARIEAETDRVLRAADAYLSVPYGGLDAIAKRDGCSRATAARLLQAARSMGLVT